MPETLLQEARALGVNLSQACEQGLVAAIANQRRARWVVANGQAIEAWNAHVETHGLPLGSYRQF